ncbi:MAG: thioredoxin family protein, partial [Alphaproteobacteria bacterium]|nr:thioredoxin family protein [Alphaproteobacteria bacterium]
IYLISIQIGYQKTIQILIYVSLFICLFLFIKKRLPKSIFMGIVLILSVGLGYTLISITLFEKNNKFLKDDMSQNDPKLLNTWEIFDPNLLDIYRKEKRLVLVDVTAAWCLTCKLNDLFVFNKKAVLETLKSHNVVMMKADWTKPDKTIANYIQSFGKYGIPLTVIYTPEKVKLLPELLSSTILMKEFGFSNVSN